MPATVEDLQTPEASPITHVVLDPMGGMVGGFPSAKEAAKAALRQSRQISNLGKTFNVFELSESVSTQLADPDWDEYVDDEEE